MLNEALKGVVNVCRSAINTMCTSKTCNCFANTVEPYYVTKCHLSETNFY